MNKFFPLVKYCKPEYSPLNGCMSIQLGTAEYYRAMDPSFSIADSQEGLITAVDEINNVTQVDVSGPNCYLFCVSTKEFSKERANKLFKEDYDSCYYISHPKDFAPKIADILKSQLSIDDFSPSSQRVLQQPNTNIKLFWHYSVVDYSERPVLANLSTEDDYEIMHLKSQFLKRRKYVNDAEFRFVFTLYAIREGTRQLISPKYNPKILYFGNELLDTGVFLDKKGPMRAIDDQKIIFGSC